MFKLREKRWYKLDNSAKIIPSMTNNLNTNVFRLVCSLKEKVEADKLAIALKMTCEEFPMFTCKMKSGLFWHYLETSSSDPFVEEDHVYPCSKLDGDLLFKVTYYKNRINLDMYHVLADGNGALEFLKYLVACYLDLVYGLSHHDKVNTASIYAKESDDFKKFSKFGKKKVDNQYKSAYKLKFPRKENTVGDVIEVHLSASEIKRIAHECDCTVTVYLTAILIRSIVECAHVGDLKKPIGIIVPIDLRGIFPSQTVRNFFYTVNIQYEYREEDTLLDIINFLKEKFSEKFSKDNLQALLDSYMSLEKLLLLRIIPNFLKDFILGIITGFRNTETMGFSNLGVIKMPEVYSDYICAFSGVMSTVGLQLTTMTYNDELRFSFMSHFLTNEIEKNMVKFLKDAGIEKCKIVSNKE